MWLVALIRVRRLARLTDGKLDCCPGIVARPVSAVLVMCGLPYIHCNLREKPGENYPVSGENCQVFLVGAGGGVRGQGSGVRGQASGQSGGRSYGLPAQVL